MMTARALRILGLTPHAREAQIRAAWRAKAKLLHPDSPYGNAAAFLEAKAAYDVLTPRPEQSLKRRVRVRATSRRAG
ncbi:DnaJ domain-containing protein [Robiginitomaculum antarcticum]|uniref:DnaJ domain-containing protein n=1 Tax=Robiginitomaculum antarcticum TaxID=437507 RepID=UPI00037CD50A|nr:DnaJ domain-containing protein [Robiginitomaculum antarcticum]